MNLSGLLSSLGVPPLLAIAVAFLLVAVIFYALAGPLQVVAAGIDSFNRLIGRWCAWLVVAAVIVSAGNAIIRKLLSSSSNAWLELQWLLFGVVFLLCSPWTLMQGEHIRIDIVNGMLPKRVRSGIDLVGHLWFLIPMCLVMMWTCWPVAIQAIRSGEISSSYGGLPLWPARTVIAVGFTLLFFQGLSELIKRFAIVRGLREDIGIGGGHHSAAEEEAKRLLEAAEAEARAATAPHGQKA